MDAHEQEEQKLAELASTKCRNALEDAADESICVDCGYDEYHDTVDGIYKGLSKGKSNHSIWGVELNEIEMVYLFIDESYQAAYDRIVILPNKLSDKEKEAVIKKVEGLVPNCRFAHFEDPDVNVCQFVVDSDTDHWHGKIVDGVRITAMNDPKHYCKTPKKV